MIWSIYTSSLVFTYVKKKNDLGPLYELYSTAIIILKIRIGTQRGSKVERIFHPLKRSKVK